jgi:hypothetical protein
VDETLQAGKASLLAGMRDFMADGEAAYQEEHIADCARILDAYASAVAQAPDAQTSRGAVERAVVALNALNERCDGQLIETDQRELICAFIIHAGALRGFNREDEDVTEEWREW